MHFHRVKQFFWTFSFKLNKKEKEYLNKYLDLEQLDLFEKLSVSEQKHSIRVAIDIENKINEYSNTEIKINKERLIKVGLLHDIGKIYRRLNAIEKTIMVFLNKISKGNIKKCDKIGIIDIYYNHAGKGADILKDIIGDEKFIFMVRNHHNNPGEDIEMQILVQSDDRN